MKEGMKELIVKEDVLKEIFRFSTEEGSSVECQQLYCDVNNMPNVIDKIREEIDEQYDRVHPYNIWCAEGLEMALGIIDKHLKEEN